MAGEAHSEGPFTGEYKYSLAVCNNNGLGQDWLESY